LPQERKLKLTNMTSKFTLSVLLNIILVVGVVYLLFFNNPPIVDVTVYQKRIDSLQNLVSINNHKIDSLSGLETKKEKDIDDLKNQLANLSNKNKNLKKKYDAEVALVNSMSNDDIVDLFTETFK
jgi:peptidoglycan hydrolase CwlO-like protein